MSDKKLEAISKNFQLERSLYLMWENISLKILILPMMMDH